MSKRRKRFRVRKTDGTEEIVEADHVFVGHTQDAMRFRVIRFLDFGRRDNPVVKQYLHDDVEEYRED